MPHIYSGEEIAQRGKRLDETVIRVQVETAEDIGKLFQLTL